MPRRLTRLLVVLAVAVGTLSWTAPAAAAAPANDDFANAVALAGPAGTVSGTTIGATSEPGEPCAIEVWGCGASVWYTWQTAATTTTQVSFDTCVDAYDTTLQVFTGNSLATLEVVAEDDGACGLGSRVTFAAVPGTTYSVRVGGYGASSGTFQLEHCEGAVCSADTDSDGVSNAADDCPTGDTGWTSSGTTDRDSDGCRDAGEDADDDNDGVADASDNCPTTGGAATNRGCQVQPDSDSPETTITRDPKNKGKKNRVRYKFVSDEPGSSFECKLDQKPWKPCSSPRKYKVKDGKHKFRVRAIDPAGNPDPTADEDKFKVVD